MNEQNEEFNLDDLNETLNSAAAAPQEVPDAPVEKFIDPEDDRENWPIIKIGHVKGMPNFHFLGAAGTKQNGEPFGHELKVMRGVNSPVPPSVLHMLQDTVKTEYEQTFDDKGGFGERTPIDSPPIPYSLIKGGKYF